MTDKNKNIMILNVSTLRSAAEVTEYTHNKLDNNDSTVKGYQTNESAIKYVLKKLGYENEQLNKIIFVESKEVQSNEVISPVSGDKITTHNYLIKSIKEYCKNNNLQIPDFDQISWDKESKNSLSRIISAISDYSPEKTNIYIDYTGGLRDQSEWLRLVMTFMEYAGYKIKDILYSDFYTKRILFISDKLIKLINGAEEFTSTGRCDILYKILKNENKHSQINDLLKAMKEFSDNMLMCQANKIDTSIKELKETISNVEKMDLRNFSEEEALFINLIPQIKEKLYLNDNVSIISIVRWCAENNMIQQALTIYESKIPQFIVEKKNSNNESVFLEISDENKNELEKDYKKQKPNNDKFTWEFYTKFIDERSKYVSDEELLLDELIKLINSKFNSKYNIKTKHKQNQEFVEIIDALKLIKDNSAGEEDFQNSLNTIKTNKNSTLEKLVNIINKEGWKTFKTTINVLTNNYTYLKELLNMNTENSTDKSHIEERIEKRIEMICTNWIKEKEKTKINPKIPNENIKQILLDYAFIKQIRNTLNHASNVEEKNLKYFCRQGSPSIDEKYLTLNIENVKEFIINALDYIEGFCR